MPASFRLDGLDPYVPAEMFRECFQDRYLWISANTVVARRAAVREAGGIPPELEWHGDWFASLPRPTLLADAFPLLAGSGGGADAHVPGPAPPPRALAPLVRGWPSSQSRPNALL